MSESEDVVHTLQRPRAPRWLLWLAAAALVVVLVLGAFLGGALVQGAAEVAQRERIPDETVVREGPAVVKAVQRLARLETAAFHMERVIELTDKQWAKIYDFGIEDAILLVAAADVRAGVDLAKLQPGDVQVDAQSGSVTIRLPPAEILSSRLDDQRTFVYQRDTDWLARRSEDLETRARRQAAETLREAAREAGILDHARRGAEATLGALIESLGYEAVEISWRTE